MCSFEAKVKGIPCVIDLDDNYNIEKITTKDSGWIVTIPMEEIKALEENYDYIINELKNIIEERKNYV